MEDYDADASFIALGKKLNFDKLRKTNIKRCTSKDGFNHPLDGWSVAEWGAATAGELGEACNIAKKLIRVRDGVVGNKRNTRRIKSRSC